jgi:hypothetical protein
MADRPNSYRWRQWTKLSFIGMPIQGLNEWNLMKIQPCRWAFCISIPGHSRRVKPHYTLWWLLRSHPRATITYSTTTLNIFHIQLCRLLLGKTVLWLLWEEKLISPCLYLLCIHNEAVSRAGFPLGCQIRAPDLLMWTLFLTKFTVDCFSRKLKISFGIFTFVYYFTFSLHVKYSTTLSLAKW